MLRREPLWQHRQKHFALNPPKKQQQQHNNNKQTKKPSPPHTHIAGTADQTLTRHGRHVGQTPILSLSDQLKYPLWGSLPPIQLSPPPPPPPPLALPLSPYPPVWSPRLSNIKLKGSLFLNLGLVRGQFGLAFTFPFKMSCFMGNQVFKLKLNGVVFTHVMRKLFY